MSEPVAGDKETDKIKNIAMSSCTDNKRNKYVNATRPFVVYIMTFLDDYCD